MQEISGGVFDFNMYRNRFHIRTPRRHPNAMTYNEEMNLECLEDVTDHMYRRSNIMMFESTPIRANEDFLLNKSYDAHEYFMTLLKSMNQYHLYQILDTEQNYYSGMYGFLNGLPSASNVSITCIPEQYRYLHQQKVYWNFPWLLKNLDTENGLITLLNRYQVISNEEKEQIVSTGGRFLKRTLLLSIVMRKSPRKFYFFVNALEETGQGRVVYKLTNTEETLDISRNLSSNFCKMKNLLQLQSLELTLLRRKVGKYAATNDSLKTNLEQVKMVLGSQKDVVQSKENYQKSLDEKLQRAMETIMRGKSDCRLLERERSLLKSQMNSLQAKIQVLEDKNKWNIIEIGELEERLKIAEKEKEGITMEMNKLAERVNEKSKGNGMEEFLETKPGNAPTEETTDKIECKDKACGEKETELLLEEEKESKKTNKKLEDENQSLKHHIDKQLLMSGNDDMELDADQMLSESIHEPLKNLTENSVEESLSETGEKVIHEETETSGTTENGTDFGNEHQSETDQNPYKKDIGTSEKQLCAEDEAPCRFGRRYKPNTWRNIDGRVVTGMTILADEIFLVMQRSNEVEVHDKVNLNMIRKFAVEHLTNPTDIVSCPRSMRLYIANKRTCRQQDVGFILPVDPQCNILKPFWVAHDSCRLSVTRESNIVVTLPKVRKLILFSPDGTIIKEIALRTETPFHSIQATSGNFVVGYGRDSGLCIIDSTGNVVKSTHNSLKEFEEKKSVPICLTVNNSGSVCVLFAEEYGGRVVLLTSDLDYRQKLLSWHHEVPRRICFDVTDGRLFVAGNDSIDGEPCIWIYSLQME